MNRASKNRQKQRGSVFIEFAACFALFWVPLFVGTYQVGFLLVREIQVTQLCRDAGHMYSQGSNFNLPEYQTLLTQLTPRSIKVSSTGNAVFYFSLLTYVDSTACTNAGVASPISTSNCPNLGQMVVTQQIPVGNTNLRNSMIAVPSSAICNSSNSYTITPANFVKDTSVRVSSAPITFTSSGQIAYISEMFVNSSDLNVAGFLGSGVNYSRAIF